MRPRQPIKHGTESGYVTHRRRGEHPCAACIVAHRVYFHDRKRVRLAAKLDQQLEAAGTDELPTGGRWVRCPGGIRKWVSA